jgi:hypothetical protein
MRFKFGYGLVILLAAGALNGAVMTVMPAYSEENSHLGTSTKLKEFSGKLPATPDGNISGCEAVPDSDQPGVEQCGALAGRALKFVGEAAAAWAVGKVADYALAKASESSDSNDSSGDNSFEKAARDSGDAAGDGNVAREPNTLAVPEQDFDPK